MEVRGITHPLEEMAEEITISGEEAEYWSCDCDRIGVVKSYMEHRGPSSNSKQNRHDEMYRDLSRGRVTHD